MHGVHIIYFGVGMGNTLLRVKQPSLRYLYPSSYSYMSPISSFIFICLSFQFVALYRHFPLVPLAHQVHSSTLLLTIVSKLKLLQALLTLPSEVVAKKNRERHKPAKEVG